MVAIVATEAAAAMVVAVEAVVVMVETVDMEVDAEVVVAMVADM